jgi:divalent metal cation (Fe/Co/Zn/Cd) transporter
MIGPVTRPPERTAALRRRAVVLARATVAWNVIEAGVAIGAGWVAGSIALVGFGLDATVEVLSALVILWQFRGLDTDRERSAHRLIATCFWVLAAYVAGQALWNLGDHGSAESSPVGIGLAVVSLGVMPLLAVAKRHTGEAMASSTVIADSNQSRLCAYLAAVLLVGLVLDATLGWWWADPVAAVAIAGLALNEGRESWRGDPCCD